MEKILVVDDNDDILELILMILDLEGYQAAGINNGKVLQEKVASYQPDLILLDVLLGDSDGRLLCHELKTNPKTAHIPIIMISASHVAVSHPQDYYRPDDFIAKPFDVDDLVDRVKKHLKA